MEHHEVMAKLLQVAHRLHADRIRYKEAEIANGDPVQMAQSVQIEALPISCRNILCRLREVESMNQRTLAKQMNISAQAVSESIKKLVQAGYITEVLGTQNNENRIALTAEGRIIAEKLNLRIKSHAAMVLGSLDQGELTQLDTLLSKLLEDAP